ncbi:unnamed protein product [Allacma fusca]|uniref:Uncharacterized protein n=1 Tax=Allacma fusca TaxID=39272 RepID=A0A8J2LHA1_9HEXA|nr:unnamed protein product [Allacma fusca]
MARCIRCLVLLLHLTYLFITVGSQYRDPHFYDEDYHHDDEPTNHQSQKAINPCHPSYHRLINNQPNRSYNYRFGTASRREQALCDRDLTPGWYRFNSLAGNTIPTSCPGVNYCGTRAPVWMKGTIPSTEEGIVKATGCVSVQGKCCTTQIQMLVRNCSDFIVYHLQPTPACPSAYCVGYEVPCPAGLSSESGYTPCHFPVDLLETKVSYGFSKDKSKLQFFCDVTLGGHVVPESVSLEIEWIVDEETVQAETFGLLQQHKGVLKEDKWNIGQVLQCRARARHVTINTFTSVVTSPPFNTGVLVINPIALSANEGAEPVYVEFQPSVPITCPKKEKPKKKKKQEEEEEEEEDCCVTFDVSTRGPPSPPRCASGNPFDMVVLNSCSYKVCADEWNTTHRVPIWAVNDGLVGGSSNTPESYSTVFIDIRTGETGNPPRWAEIALPTQEIHIEHADVEAKCTANDFITTFDELTYTNDLEGNFILYRHQTLPYEVQLHLRRCNKRALCNCAVAIRFGDVMVAADVCSTGRMRFWSYTIDGNYIEPAKIAHLPQIIRIDDGRSFQIQLPSGTRVNLGPNLSFINIHASLSDLEHTSGLCGTFDRNRENDFVTFKGQQACPISKNISACVDYVKSWRLATEQSLFVGAFSSDGHHGDDEAHDEGPGYGQCSCSSLKKPKEIELRPKSKAKFTYPYEDFQPEEPQEEESESSKCHTSPCVDPRGVDITSQFLELVLDEDFSADDEQFGKQVTNAAEIRPVFTNAIQNPALAQAMPKGEWTNDDADLFCRGIIEGMPATTLCRDIAHINVESFINECKREIMHTKSTAWISDALEHLRWECRDQVYHNLSIWEPQLGRQYGTPPIAIMSSLCLNNCTGVGNCENGQCHCFKGYAGADCSVNINLAPVISALNHNGVCDIRAKPCSELLVWGDKFADHSGIKCHFDVYRSASVKSVPVLSESLTTNGKLFTYQSILCDVPELAIHDAKISSFYIPGEGLDKTRTLMRVRVSYGSDSPPSVAVDFTIFDSLCWACDSPLTCQPQPSQSCNVLSEPFNTGDPFQQHSSFNTPTLGFAQSNSPLQYSPSDVSGFTPSNVPGGLITPVHSIQQQAHLHPQLGNPCFLPKDTGPCRNDILRHFFDSSAGKCRPFIYGGCQGNSNNFLTEQDCTLACSTPPGPPTVPASGISAQSSSPQAQPAPTEIHGQFAAHHETYRDLQNIPEKCRQGNNPGPCQEEIVRYYFDSIMKKCRPFIYGGCGGNSNNFQTKSLCAQECERTPQTENPLAG